MLKIISRLRTFIRPSAIRVKTVPLNEQFYPTLGDYFVRDDKWSFKITSTGNPDYDRLIFLHEFVELLLTQKRGIAVQEITDFDLRWEAENDLGLRKEIEPGNESDAPYHTEHVFAESIERKICEELGYDWEEYTGYLDKLI